MRALGKSARASAPLVQLELQRARSIKRVLAVVDKHFHILDGGHVSLALQKLAALPREGSESIERELLDLLRLVEHHAAQLPDKELLRLARSLVGLARPDNPAWQAIGSAVAERIPRLDTDLAPLLAALAAARGAATEAFRAAEKPEVVASMSDATLAGVLSAMVVARQSPASGALLEAVAARTPNFEEAVLRQVSAALANLGSAGAPSVARLMEDLELRKPQNLETSTQIALLWACARAPALDALGAERLSRMADQVGPRLSEATPAELSRLSWVLVQGRRQFGPMGVSFLEAALSEVRERLGEFNSSQLSTVLWAAAEVAVQADAVLPVAARLTSLGLAELPEASLGSLTVSVPKLGLDTQEGASLLALAAAEVKLRCDNPTSRTPLSPATLSSVLCSLAERLPEDGQRLLSALEPTILAQLTWGHFGPKHLARLAHAAASLPGPSAALREALARAVRVAPGDFEPGDLAKLGQSFAKLQLPADYCRDLAEASRSPTCPSGKEVLAAAAVWAVHRCLSGATMGGAVWVGTAVAVPDSEDLYRLMRGLDDKCFEFGKMSFGPLAAELSTAVWRWVYGLEWSFSDIVNCTAEERMRTGVFSAWPKQSPGHRYVESVSMGFTSKSEVQVLNLVAGMEAIWPVASYNVLRRNCCHFVDELCKKIGVGGIPPRLMSLAGAGVSLVEYSQAAADYACCTSNGKVCSLSCCYDSTVDKSYQELHTPKDCRTSTVKRSCLDLVATRFSCPMAQSLQQPLAGESTETCCCGLDRDFTKWVQWRSPTGTNTRAERLPWQAGSTVLLLAEMAFYFYFVAASAVLVLIGAIFVVKALVEIWGQQTPTWLCPGTVCMLFVIYVLLIPTFSSMFGYCTMASDINFTGRSWVGLVLYLFGSSFALYYEVHRFRFKAKPENKGKLHTVGPAAWCIHPNYFGDLFTYTGRCWFGQCLKSAVVRS
ncbi:unnamed protein product [Symbiodinium sp. CCMP2592]|nr:unnamed protein product [Symbiodinium sp. CCMP2592]